MLHTLRFLFEYLMPPLRFPTGRTIAPEKIEKYGWARTHITDIPCITNTRNKNEFMYTWKRDLKKNCMVRYALKCGHMSTVTDR